MGTLLTGSGSQVSLKATGVRVETTATQQLHPTPHPTCLHYRTTSNITHILNEGNGNSLTWSSPGRGKCTTSSSQPLAWAWAPWVKMHNQSGTAAHWAVCCGERDGRDEGKGGRYTDPWL